MGITKEEYEDNVEKLSKQYNELADDEKEKALGKIYQMLIDYKKNFEEAKDSYYNNMNNIIDSAMSNKYKLKLDNMIQRTMIQKLFTDYCDAQFYFSFERCDSRFTSLSGNFSDILEDLLNIQWEAIHSLEKFTSGIPTEFEKPIIVQDFAEKKLFPIKNLKTSGYVYICITKRYQFFCCLQFWAQN